MKAVHAGLECGIIGEKYPGMDMVSFGPTLEGVHSPDEKIYIDTVEKYWDFLLAICRPAIETDVFEIRRCPSGRCHAAISVCGPTSEPCPVQRMFSKKARRRDRGRERAKSGTFGAGTKNRHPPARTVNSPG